MTLLIGGADPNMIFVLKERRPRSAIRLAMTLPENNCVEIVRILLEYEADCNQVDAEGYRPLYYAISNELWQAAELLLQHGANPSDLGNGINALRPESFQHEPGFYRSAMWMKFMLRKYSTESERRSRRDSIAAEDT